MDNRRTRSRKNRNTKKRKERSFNYPLLIKIAIVILIIFLATIFSILNMGSSHIINNVYINGISVSSLSKDEARNKLEPILNKQLEQEIPIKFDNYETTILPAEISFTYDVSTALEEAYSIGRTGNILTNNFRILVSLFKKTDINVPYLYSNEMLDNIIENISVEIPNLVVNPTYYISGNELVLSKGSSGNLLDKIKTKQIILSSIDKNKSVIDLPVSKVEPEAINISKIHEEVYCEPENAVVTKTPYSIKAEKKGIDFDISIEEAENLVSSSQGNEIYIPLKYTDAEIKIADLGEDIFGNKISTSFTKYDFTNTNRATNLELAVNKINGTVLEPGEIFSFNKVVGERSARNGFKEAIVYADGELDYGLGGGICQISSNLYYSVLLANLEVVERKNHSMTVSYLPIGCDATVSYGSVDFKFKNSRSYPIKIEATMNSGIINISILGAPEEIEYKVDIVVETTQQDDFPVTYEYSSSVPVGQEIIKQTGKYGYKCSTYRILYKNGNVVSKELLSTDTYRPQKQIVQKHR